MVSKKSRNGTPTGGPDCIFSGNGIDEATRIAKPLTVTVATARRISGLGNTTLWALIKDRRLQAVRIGRRTLITYRSLEALLEPDSGTEPKPSHCVRWPHVDRAPGDR